MKIGLIGLAGAGKDTVAAMLLDELSAYGYSIDRYAKPLKDAARSIFGDNFDDRDVKEVVVDVDPDTVIEASFNALHSCKLTIDENDKASELFFEHLGFKDQMSPREYQQVFGTEVGRATRTTIWSDRLTKSNRNLIIPDVRFAGELEDFNILIIRHPIAKGTVHSSELLATEMQSGLDDSYNTILFNDSTLEHLKQQVTQLAHKLIKRGLI